MAKTQSFQIQTDKKFEAQLKRATAVVSDLRIPFTEMAKEFAQSRKSIFKLTSAGQYPDFKGPKIGDTWKTPGHPQLRIRDGKKTAYQDWKFRKYGFEYPLLKATGKLEQSITEVGAPGNITYITEKTLTLGTSVEYGIFHQSDESRSKIPLRKFLFLDGEADGGAQSGILAKFNNILNSFILRSLGSTLGEATGSTAVGS